MQIRRPRSDLAYLGAATSSVNGRVDLQIKSNRLNAMKTACLVLETELSLS